MEVCLLAGRLMLQNGAETYRVEDTITRLAQNYGMKAAQVFVTPTAIILSLFEKGRTMDYTKIVRIVDRSTDLHVVVLVNDLSRKVASESLSLDTARKELKNRKNTRGLSSMGANVGRYSCQWSLRPHVSGKLA